MHGSVLSTLTLSFILTMTCLIPFLELFLLCWLPALLFTCTRSEHAPLHLSCQYPHQFISPLSIQTTLIPIPFTQPDNLQYGICNNFFCNHTSILSSSLFSSRSSPYRNISHTPSISCIYPLLYNWNSTRKENSIPMSTDLSFLLVILPHTSYFISPLLLFSSLSLFPVTLSNNKRNYLLSQLLPIRHLSVPNPFLSGTVLPEEEKKELNYFIFNYLYMICPSHSSYSIPIPPLHPINSNQYTGSLSLL